MPTLYVENVPKDLYESLRRRARQKRRSITAEVLALLEDAVPTERELKARRHFFEKMKALRSQKSPTEGVFPTTEELQREDRSR